VVLLKDEEKGLLVLSLRVAVYRTEWLVAVFPIRFKVYRIRNYLYGSGLVYGSDPELHPDPSINKQKN
jgi:hypothetical protein